MLRQALSNPTVISILKGQLRHLGTASGVWLAAQGYVGGGDVETIAGIVVAIGSMILSALAKRV